MACHKKARCYFILLRNFQVHTSCCVVFVCFIPLPYFAPLNDISICFEPVKGGFVPSLCLAHAMPLCQSFCLVSGSLHGVLSLVVLLLVGFQIGKFLRNLGFFTFVHGSSFPLLCRYVLYGFKP